MKYCTIYECNCFDVPEITENKYVCNMECMFCEHSKK